MPANPRYCCICSNHSKKWDGGRKISMHRFPMDQRLRRVWLQRCRLVRADFHFRSNDSTRLCSDHFEGKMGPSPSHPLPTLFPTRIFKISRLDENVPDESVDVSSILVVDQEDVPTHRIDKDTEDQDQNIMIFHNLSAVQSSLYFNDYCGDVSMKTSKHFNQSVQTSPDAVSIGTQTEISTVPFKVLTKECGTQTETISNTINTTCSIQCNRPTLTYEDIKVSDENVCFYTGFPSAAVFEHLYNEIKDDDQLNSCASAEGGRPSSLRLIDEFLMVLMRLRLGLLLQDLAYRFHVSSSTCSRIFNKWVGYLYVQLSVLICWPDRQNIDFTMQMSFRKKYPSCRVVIDCTEIRTDTPSSLQMRSLLYSDYKSHMTYKGLVGISPAGAVTFVSDLYNGSISDKQITKLSGLIDLCEEGDAIMADKGFLISDFTTPKGVDLIIPPFKNKRKQLSTKEVQQTKDIANLRIHVEREMERIKNFRLLQGNMQLSMAS